MKNETGTEPKFKTKNTGPVYSALLELFLENLRDLYWAENHLVKTLPKMASLAASTGLANAVEKHLEETRIHVQRLEEIFDLVSEKAIAKKCDAMEALTKEGEIAIESTNSGTATRDVAIILASQRVEHYEIASYGGLAQLAKTLGLEQVASLLAQTLEEEKAADVQLTEIAENDVNYEAAEEL